MSLRRAGGELWAWKGLSRAGLSQRGARGTQGKNQTGAHTEAALHRPSLIWREDRGLWVGSFWGQHLTPGVFSFMEQTTQLWPQPAFPISPTKSSLTTGPGGLRRRGGHHTQVQNLPLGQVVPCIAQARAGKAVQQRGFN